MIYIIISNKFDNTCTTMFYKHNNQNISMVFMILVGQVSSREEANEINFIAKLFAVGQRARYLAKQNEGNN